MSAPEGGRMIEEPDEEVRSKHWAARRKRSESVTAECGEDGVKSIKDILSCADVQLQASKDFAEKLAKRRCIHTHIATYLQTYALYV